MNETTEYDYIIVGAGTAGCVLANRLSADPQTQVLMLEAGDKDNFFWIDIPVGYLYTIANPRTDWCYQTEPDPGLNNRRIGYARGKVLGGSSSINGHLIVRGQREDFDGWRQLGNTGWSFDDVLPYFKRFESAEVGDDEIRGRHGPIRVREPIEQHPLAQVFMDACEELGIPRNPDYNGATQEGVGFFQYALGDARRMSTARGFLKPARRRRNLQVETKALTKWIITKEGRATGVRFKQNGFEREAHARCEVILSAGSIASPQILERSGIGDGERLIRFGWDALRYAFTRKGLLTTAPGNVSASIKVMPGVATPDVQLAFAPASYVEGQLGVLDDFPGMTCGVW